MLDLNQAELRVAILTTSDKTQQRLAHLLQETGLEIMVHEIMVHEIIGPDFLAQLEKFPADVLLVDLSEGTDSEVDIIDTLLEYDSIPVFFNDSSPASSNTTALWAKKLARKLASMAHAHRARAVIKAPLDSDEKPEPVIEPKLDAEFEPDPELILESISEQQFPKPEFELESLETITSSALETGEQATIKPEPDIIAAGPTFKPTPEPKNQPDGAATNIWVLGASLGGPQAVRQFLAATKADLPVAFLLAQHIGANHIELLAEQLNRITPLKVISGTSGYLLRHHEVVLAPADKHISITQDGYLSLSPAPAGAIYSPSIDNAITAVAERYGRMAGAIVFSGMGDDGASGCKTMADHGGVVWAQNIESCVISSMPDQARKTHSVTYSADPGCLAEKLYSYYSDGRT